LTGSPAADRAAAGVRPGRSVSGGAALAPVYVFASMFPAFIVS